MKSLCYEIRFWDEHIQGATYRKSLSLDQIARYVYTYGNFYYTQLYNSAETYTDKQINLKIFLLFPTSFVLSTLDKL
jgi:hypothetical protein